MSSEAAHKAWATRRAKAQRFTPAKRLRLLADAQAKWLRRETIARNKLKKIRRLIEEMAEEVLNTPTPSADTVWARRKIAK